VRSRTSFVEVSPPRMAVLLASSQQGRDLGFSRDDLFTQRMYKEPFLGLSSRLVDAQ
jgi:hypothetical protein